MGDDMSKCIDCEVLEMEGEPVEGICLGVGYYPEGANTLPINEG